MKNEVVNFRDLYKAIDELRQEINIRFDGLEKKIDNNFVNIDKFNALREKLNPIEKIVYGQVGIILAAVIGALMAIILRK